ncbi:HAD-IA family hydrolase [Clostridium perfringens]|nr:HAD-IA family hydrolase [Clostridium perfringens]
MKTFDKSRVKAILFDSGRVLNQPSTGHWFIPPKFFSYVDKHKFDSIKKSRKREAFSKAYEYIDKQKFILTEGDEYTHFLEYYKIFSNNLPELGLTNGDIKSITTDYVYNYEKYTFFEDVPSVLQKLSQSYKLAIVSDAWPSLEGIFINMNLRKYFSSFIISSQKGITKPNELMFRLALQELNLSPKEALFIDDNPKNCEAAIKFGIPSIILCRDLKSYIYTKIKYRNILVARNLNDIYALLK